MAGIEDGDKSCPPLDVMMGIISGAVVAAPPFRTLRSLAVVYEALFLLKGYSGSLLAGHERSQC